MNIYTLKPAVPRIIHLGFKNAKRALFALGKNTFESSSAQFTTICLNSEQHNFVCPQPEEITCNFMNAPCRQRLWPEVTTLQVPPYNRTLYLYLKHHAQ